jgi:hypothetical protein
MTFKSISTSGTVSSKASSLFDLDENGNKSILVYRYRSGAKGLEVRTEHDLCAELDHGTLSSTAWTTSTNSVCSQTPTYRLCASPGNPYLAATAG